MKNEIFIFITLSFYFWKLNNIFLELIRWTDNPDKTTRGLNGGMVFNIWVWFIHHDDKIRMMMDGPKKRGRGKRKVMITNGVMMATHRIWLKWNTCNRGRAAQPKPPFPLPIFFFFFSVMMSISYLLLPITIYSKDNHLLIILLPVREREKEIKDI